MTSICTFPTKDSVNLWHCENDTVMGGVSQSQIKYLNEDARHRGILVFEGSVSLENNGGFAQMLYENDLLDLSQCSHLELTLKGDGKNYQVRIETRSTHVGYSQTFATTHEWSTVKLAFADFTPDFHGEPVPDAPPLDLTQIKNIGILIGNNQEESFRLLLNEVRCY